MIANKDQQKIRVDIADWVKKRKKELNKTLKQIAMESGLSLSTISNIVSARHEVYPATLKKLEKVLDEQFTLIATPPLKTMELRGISELQKIARQTRSLTHVDKLRYLKKEFKTQKSLALQIGIEEDQLSKLMRERITVSLQKRQQIDSFFFDYISKLDSDELAHAFPSVEETERKMTENFLSFLETTYQYPTSHFKRNEKLIIEQISDKKFTFKPDIVVRNGEGEIRLIADIITNKKKPHEQAFQNFMLRCSLTTAKFVAYVDPDSTSFYERSESTSKSHWKKVTSIPPFSML